MQGGCETVWHVECDFLWLVGTSLYYDGLTKLTFNCALLCDSSIQLKLTYVVVR